MNRYVIGFLFVSAWPLAGCGDQATTTNAVDCSACPAGAVCDPDLFCAPSGSADGGADIGYSQDAGAPDEPEASQETGGADLGCQSNGDGECPGDVGGHVDAHDETRPDVVQDLAESDDSGPDTGGEGEADTEPVSCVDSFERHRAAGVDYDDNNAWARATRAHDSPLLARDRSCGRGAWGTCRVDGDCGCDAIAPLVLCDPQDSDALRFSVLRGDPVDVRVAFVADPLPTAMEENVLVFLWRVRPGADEAAQFPPFGERTRAIWNRTEGSFDLRFAATAEDTAIVSDYVLMIVPASPLVSEWEYRVDLQVGSESRSCPGDPWDAEWDVYRPDGESEQNCAAGTACELGVGPRSGQICPWDEGDAFRFRSNGDPVSLRVNFSAGASRLVAHVVSSAGDVVDSLCPLDGDSCRQETFLEDTLSLPRGVYNLRVAGHGDFSPNAFTVERL